MRLDAARLKGCFGSCFRQKLLPEVQGAPHQGLPKGPPSGGFFRFCALRYTHRRRRSIMIPGSRDGHSGFCRNAPCTPAGRGGRERRSRWAVKADALQIGPTPSRGWRGPQAEQAEDSGLLKALPPVTWSRGSAQRGRCPYRHAPLVGPKGQNPRGYNHGGRL